MLCKICSFFLLFFFSSLPVWAWELETAKPIYAPGDEILVTLSWEPEDFSNATSGSLALRLTLPGGKSLYLTPQSLRPGAALYGSVDLSRSQELKVLDFSYPGDSWLPPGSYLLEAVVAEEGANGFTSPVRRLLPPLSVRFELTSHFIPVTYADADPEVGPFEVARVEDGFWVVMAAKPYESHKGYPLWAMKLSPDGHTLVPPFFTGIYEHSANLQARPGFNAFAVQPTPSGGFYVLANITSAQGTYYRDLMLYEFDSSGRRRSVRVLKSKGKGFSGLWFRVRPEGLFVLCRYDRSLKLYIFGDEEREIILEDQFSSYDFFKAAFDETQGRLLVLTIKDFGDDGIFWTALSPSGSVIFRQEIPAADYGNVDIGNVGHPDDLLPVANGYLVFRPSHENPAYLILRKDGTYEAKLLSGEGYYYHSGGWSLLREGEIVHVFFNGFSGDYGYLSFNLAGDLLTPPTPLLKSSTYVYPPFLASTEKGLFFLANDQGHLKAFFLGWDRPREADLVLSPAWQRQSPAPYAALGRPTQLTLRVFNRGETTSEETSLTLTYLGQQYQAQLEALPPGEWQEVSFSLEEPSFLTQQPLLEAQVLASDYGPNNRLSSWVVFYPHTPVYPAESQTYSWQVMDAASGAPLSRVRVSYTLPQVAFVSGEQGEVTLEERSDEAGHFETVLPPGSYRFLLHKPGYPDQYLSVEVPGAGEVLAMQPPGEVHFQFQDAASGGALHPGPQMVSVTLAHQPDANFPAWEKYVYEPRGSSEGFTLSEVMPGAYTLKVSAFGYAPVESSVTVSGGETTEATLSLSPLPRGRLTGRVVSEGHGVSGAEVTLLGTPLTTSTNSSGAFVLEDVPLEGDYALEVAKEGYATRVYPASPRQEETDLGDLLLPEIYRRTYPLEGCRYAAWVQDAEWSVGDSYKIKTIYGVWDMSGALHYIREEGSSQMDINQFDLDIEGLRWVYWGLEANVVQAFVNWYLGALGEYYTLAEYASQVWEVWDWANTPGDFMVTYQNLADPLGTVRGGVVDCGELDALDGLNPPSPDDPSDRTVLRIDDLRVYQGEELLYSLHDRLGWRQYFSDDYQEETLKLPVVLSGPVTNPEDLRVALYFTVENGDYDSAPLAGLGIDRFKLSWRLRDGKLVLEAFVPDPPDYPRFEE